MTRLRKRCGYQNNSKVERKVRAAARFNVFIETAGKFQFKTADMLQLL